MTEEVKKLDEDIETGLISCNPGEAPTSAQAQAIKEDAQAVREENERRETLRHKVVADFVLMCSEFLFNEFLNKLKEMEQKKDFFDGLKENEDV